VGFGGAPRRDEDHASICGASRSCFSNRVAAEELVRFGKSLGEATSDGRARAFDLARNWQFVGALLSDSAIHVRWLFVSDALRAALLAEARRQSAPAALSGAGREGVAPAIGCATAR
jgi:hypothetical protein